jgi:hypothetical protein
MNNKSADVVGNDAATSEAPDVCLDALRHQYVVQINAELRKADGTSSRSDSHYLNMGRLICQFIQKGKTAGEPSEDALFRSIVKDKACKVKKSALYNARGYYRLYSAMCDAHGSAPEVPMTYYVKVRSKYLSVGEQRELLLKAEADRDITIAQMGRLVKEQLVELGYAKKALLPTDVFLAPCQQALRVAACIGGLMKKGLCPSNDSFSSLMKAAALLASTAEKAKLLVESGTPIPSEDTDNADIADEAGEAERADVIGDSNDLQEAFEPVNADGMVNMGNLS